MGKIKQLPLHEAQKIAAGEVVERPANVVKELIENSIDAGAHHIQIYLEDAGQTALRVVDDGFGMSLEDAQACFGHHATSKISSVHDLITLSSFGFRGEALASIAAVSTVELITKEPAALHGIKLIRENNEIKSITEISCASGTDITVRNLFYNVPARKKFLKTPATELRAIIHLMQALCFDYPDIHISLYSDGKELYNCPPARTLAERAHQILHHQAQNLIPFNLNNDYAKITGLISNHQWHRYDRQHLFFFVNRRWIKNQALTKAVLRGYQNSIAPGQFPCAIVVIDIDPVELDINIHPRKQEVEFLHPRTIEQLLQKAVKEALENNLSHYLKKTVTIHPIQQDNFFDNHRPMSPIITQPSTSSINQVHQTAFKPYPSSQEKEKQEKPLVYEQPSLRLSDHPELLSEDDGQAQKDLTPSEHTIRLIGQLHTTYLLIEHKDGLFILDQHAAHERVLYEQFRTHFGSIATVNLLFAQVIKLSQTEFETIAPYLEHIGKHGIQAEPFGNNQLIVQSSPVHLKHVSMQELFNEIIGLIGEHRSLPEDDFFKTLHEKLHAQMACKAAVKAGDKLSPEHMQHIINDLAKTENRFSCPHGRPTGWLISSHELEKKFKRV